MDTLPTLPANVEKSSHLSIVRGPDAPDLWPAKLSDVLDRQAKEYGKRDAVVFPSQKHRLNYSQLQQRSCDVAKALLGLGLKKGDCVGIMAGNCYQYIEACVGAARIGCPFAVYNNTYTAKELVYALQVSSCKLLILPNRIGPKDLSGHFEIIETSQDSLRDLQHVVQLSSDSRSALGRFKLHLYDSFITDHSRSVNDDKLRQAEDQVKANDIFSLQFTSGTTGPPKAAMLSFVNMVNNGLLVGAGLNLTTEDVICCPPPLFHCFGLTMGFCAAVTHACSIVFPSEQFDPEAVLDAIVAEKCTSLYGVPTMHIAELAANKKKGLNVSTLKHGLNAGASVPTSLMRQLKKEFGVEGMLIAYGMTETSPVTFMTGFDDPEEKRVASVGRIMPHSAAKVINKEGEIVPRGVAGELCTAGYALQKGYWNNEAKTKEAMKTDSEGVRWMHTGDECIIDESGYCYVTGRIKDMIIRGGENITPLEIEEVLLEHDAIVEASVVGLKDYKYGEIVGAFVRIEEGKPQPSVEEVLTFARSRLSRHKTPVHVFWVGDPEACLELPKTGSGKIQKHILRKIGDDLVAKNTSKAKL